MSIPSTVTMTMMMMMMMMMRMRMRMRIIMTLRKKKKKNALPEDLHGCDDDWNGRIPPLLLQQ